MFLVFDNTDAEDEAFKDTPANLESVVMLGAAGSVQRVNVSLQTTLIAQQVRAMLDPDGDGTIIDDAAIQTAITDATDNISAHLRPTVSDEICIRQASIRSVTMTTTKCMRHHRQSAPFYDPPGP